jgi:signal transduction histidine kinase
LFEAFYATKSNGMGIGLFISRTIVERHRGRLWAEPNEGHGATFSFSIPHDPQMSRPKGAVKPEEGQMNGNNHESRAKPVVSVIDDDESARESLELRSTAQVGRQNEYLHASLRAEGARASRIAALGQMPACIVHEINQPVAALLINTQAALRFLDGPNPNLKESQHALTRVLQLGNRIVEIVRRTRALVERVPPQRDDFEINEAIREMISLSREELVKNGVFVHTRFAQGLPVVRADPIQVQQVILNLITNAVQAMSGVCAGTRELRISTGQTTSGDILVAVQDSGPGLDAQSLDHLFDAFYSTKPRGLGIGLSICRAIIEAHGGRLWVNLSEPHGATFQFTLPQFRSELMPKTLQRRSKIEVKACAASEST